MSLNMSYDAPIIFGKRDYINSMKDNYNKALLDYNIKENIAKELHYSRNKYNIDLPKTLQEAENTWIEPKLIGFNYPAAYYHQD